MPELRVEVDAEVADALETEAGLLGFEHQEAYLAWIVENRAAIEQGTESAELLAAYRGRLAALRERLAAEGVDPGDVPGEPVADAPTGGEPAEPPAESSKPSAESPAPAAKSPEPSAEFSGPSAESSEPSAESREPVQGDPEPAASEADPERAGTPNRDVEATDSTGSPATAASDGGTAASEADITSMHLRPERVQRINEDPVARDAGELSEVETTRVDEMSRRAVAETRRQLDRDVETGLDYDSSAAMPGSDVRPGEDLADLEGIEVPGRDESLVAERREVVGRALAFLRDEGRARRSDVVEELYADHPVGYETADSWWRCVREGLRQVEAVDGGQVWEYEG